MGVFKNKVGRPSNKVKKKRRIIKIMIVLLIIIIGIVMYFTFIKNKSNVENYVIEPTYHIKEYDKYIEYKTKNYVICDEIPNKYKPYDEVKNPEGLHEYGFTSKMLYSAIVSSIKNDKSYCDNITEEDFEKIKKISINVSGASLKKINGLEYLKNLIYLDISGFVESIDLSKNAKLEYIKINNWDLESLNINNLKQLKHLFITHDARVKNLDLSDNKKLQDFEIYLSGEELDLDLKEKIDLRSLFIRSGKKLRSLDLSNNKKLTKLSINAGNLQNVNIKDLPELEELQIENKSINSLNLNKSINLKKLHLLSCELNDIDLSKNKKLEDIEIRILDHRYFTYETDEYENPDEYKHLKSIDLSNNVNLKKLEIYGGVKLKSINLRNNKKLKYIYLSENNLNSIDLSNLTNLRNLWLNNNNISEIDLSNNKKLEDIHLSNNNLNSIDLSKNKKLEDIDLSNNNLNSIDLSNNKKLEDIDLSNNNLNSIDLRNNKKLECIYLSNNNLNNIYLRKNIKLKRLSLSNNKFNKIDLSGINEISSLYISNNEISNILFQKYGNYISVSLNQADFVKNIIKNSDIYISFDITLKNNEEIDLKEYLGSEIISNYTLDESYYSSYNDLYSYGNGILRGNKNGECSILLTDHNNNKNIRIDLTVTE